MSDIKTEVNFEKDLEVMEQRVAEALNNLGDVKAYTLKPDELRDFKAAQYALRNLAPDKEGNYNIGDLYE